MVSAPSAPQSTNAVVWVSIMSLRLSKRSAMTPPQTPKTSTGTNCRNTVNPTAVTLWVSWNTSQSMAMRCIHAEVLAITCEIT